MKEITIVIIAFNRPNSIQRLLTSLEKLIVLNNEKVRLYISIDRNNSKENQKVVEIANSYIWKFGEKIVNYRDKNLGLKEHVLKCGNLTNEYENIIVLEDDIVISPLMIIYAKQVLSFYQNDNNIAGFGLYSFQRNPLNHLPFTPMNNSSDVYFLQHACSWGQIWTKEKWNEFYNWYLKNKNTDFYKYKEIPTNIINWGEKSWLKYYVIYNILNNKFFVYPQVGLTSNFTDKGTHNKESSIAYQCNIYSDNLDPKTIKFKFTPFSKSNNKYDAFFENIDLKNILNEKNIIIADFYGEKSIEYINQQKGYLLSTKKYNYKIIKSYALNMYPYEMNIINNITGNDIFLYNKEIPEKNKLKYNKIKLFKYVYKLDFLSKEDILRIIKNLTKDLINRLFVKIKGRKK